MSRLFMLIALLLVSSLSFATNYYRWVDDKGRVHYAETPPVGVESTIEANRREGSLSSPLSEQAPGDASDEANAQPGAAKKTASDAKSKEDKAEPSEAEQRAANCDIARDNLRIMANNQRIKIKQDDGTERSLTDAEIQAKKDEMEKNVDEFCN